MPLSAPWETQKSIYQTLTQNTEIITLLGGAKIYDHVPQRASYPYITFGQTIERDWSTATEDGSEHLILLHIWDQSGGRKLIQQIIQLIKSALHNMSLDVLGHQLINLRYEFSEVRRDPGGKTLHGICRLRAATEPLN